MYFIGVGVCVCEEPMHLRNVCACVSAGLGCGDCKGGGVADADFLPFCMV